MERVFLPETEQHIFDNTVHSLRLKGWGRGDAEDQALDVIERLRAKTPVTPPASQKPVR